MFSGRMLGGARHFQGHLRGKSARRHTFGGRPCFTSMARRADLWEERAGTSIR